VRPSDFSVFNSQPSQFFVRWLICLLCVFAGLAAATHAPGAEGPRAKRILILSTGSRFSVGFPLAEQNAVEQLRQLYSGDLEFYSEALDIIRFPSESYHRVFRDYLRDKYVDDVPDLILLIYVGNLSLAEHLLGQLFPATPVVAAGLTEEEFPVGRAIGRGVGIAQRSDPGGTIKLLRQLQPDIQNLILIGGSAEVDRQVMDRARLEAGKSFDKQQVEVWDRRAMPDILDRVKTLPPKTAILFTRMFRDGAGRAYISTQAAQSIAKAANAPVYVMSDPMIGTGAVGGSVVNIAAVGKRAGELAERILNGAAPGSLPLDIWTSGEPIFDWRALNRWGISENRLPRNSIVRFRPPSIWDQYRWYIVTALVVFLLQAGLITGLIMNRLNRRRAEKELGENQDLLEMATRAGGLGLWARDVNGNDVWTNSVLRSQLGFNPNQAVQSSDLLARIHPEDRVQVIGDVARAHEANAPYEGEFRIEVAGEERWIFAKGGTVNAPAGRDGRRMGVWLDVTERKRMEVELRESEENFRRLVETTAAVIWQADAESWRFTYVTPQAVRLLGYPLEKWYEKDFWISHIHADDRQQAIEICLTKSKIAEQFDFEYRMITASGEIVWVHDIVNCQHNANGPSQLRGLMLDITERKRSEQAIRESEERLDKERAFLRQVIDIAPNFIFAKDRQGRFTLVNQAVADAYGTTVDGLIGKTDADFNPNPDEVEYFHSMDLEVIDSLQERFIAEEHLTDAHGRTRWLQTVKRPIVDKTGVANQVLGSSTDITMRKTVDAELRQQRDELAHVSRVSLMGELAASLAHELNQPLTAILSNAQAAQRFLTNNLDEVREILNDIVEDDNRASEIIRKMRALVRKEELTLARLDLSAIVRDVVSLVHSDAILRNVKLDFQAGDAVATVRGDRTQLQQVILNLFLNAFDAMKECAIDVRQLIVRVKSGETGMVEVSVCDHGSGLTSDALDRIFQPFFTTKRDGLGMGLSISRAIIERHGGRLWAENNPDRGATFYILLPEFGPAEQIAERLQ
jgi:two-component system, LuxR family, sensor kinase FixL